MILKFDLNNEKLMSHFTKETLEFLGDLRENNKREWFHANKKKYEKFVKEPFKEFVSELIFRIQEFDPELTLEAKDAIFRINRDMRFSKDKSPYKTWISANMNNKGKRTIPNSVGYYVHIDPEFVQIGGGSYHIDKYGIHAVRTAIMDEPESINKIIKNKNFNKLYGEIQGAKNKRLPPEFKEAHETQPLLANKSFFYMTKLDANAITEPNFIEMVAEYHRVGNMFNEFLKSSLSGL
ncbi:MAG: hypothetical protein HeimC2_14110 [Candidatus Heimdallarchaeota archaeon LC_2]|nr:MAG: hypothetical protein HeimC2_14110 [Candidatus Heimdallarchaeota archaeon LC_2]